MRHNSINNTFEMRIAYLCIALSLACFAGMFHFILARVYDAYENHQAGLFIEDIIFFAAMGFMAYGGLLYQVCMVGYYHRRKSHIPAAREKIEKLYTGKAPSLSVLIPSYKEEHSVIWQTMVSAALAEYPHKNVVLLIDDPYRTKSREDMLKLEETRLIPGVLQNKFAAPLARYRGEQEAFFARKTAGNMHQGVELNRISMLYDEVAEWLEALSREYVGGRDIKSLTHTDRFFLESVITSPMQQYKLLAKELRRNITLGKAPTMEFFERHYARLASLFNVSFSSFERKKYENLSHEANKAMNLNSYIALIGKSWKEVKVTGGFELHEAAEEEADFHIPHADYVNTIDADSMMLSDYLIRMVELMERAENRRLAVVQSSVSSIPDSPNALERTAGICLDLQFMNHQGFTHWNATFWVGANAVLRYRALEDIKETKLEDGKQVFVYIQDRTVIEDTESTVDLVEKGWQLHNYPERMSFSAMPADFGSLLIQRRRWANGGMIILPKLLRYITKAPKSLLLFKEFLMRFNYLAGTTLSCAVILLLSLYRFGDNLDTMWIMLSALPPTLLYIRTLVVSGHKAFDVFRVFAINLMLMPVLFGGVFKQFQQMLTGKKIPFGRTPKVTGRTAAPAIYCLVEVVMTVGFCSVLFNDVLQHNWFHALFTAFNSAFMLYALVSFMGIDETCQDMFAGLVHSWETFSARAEATILAAIDKARAYIMTASRQV